MSAVYNSRTEYPPPGTAYNIQTRLDDDLCAMINRTKRSVGPGAYSTRDERQAQARGVVATAIANPTFTYGMGYGEAPPSEIDTESALFNNAIQTHDSKCRGDRPQPRPFATVPYMGGGWGNPNVESRLIHSEYTVCKRDTGESVVEREFPVFVPLIPIVKENIEKPSNLITEAAAPGWIHGGIPSRQYARDNCYYS